MIEILIGDVSLDLLSPSVRLEKSFGLETDVDFQQNYSFPMSLAQTANNLQALEYTSLEQTDVRKKKFDCVLKILGIDYASAKLNIIGFNPKEIRITLSWGVAALDVMEKSLRDIDFGPDEYLTGSSLANALENYFVADYTNKMCFPPIYAPNWYGEGNVNNTDFVGFVNYFNAATQHYIDNDITDPHKYSYAPAIYVFWILQKIFENAGYSLNGTAFNDPELRTLVMYQNRSLDLMEELFHTYVSTKDRLYMNCSPGVAQTILVPATFSAPTDIDDTPCWSNSLNGYQIPSAGDYVVQLTLDYDNHSGVFFSGGATSPVLEVRLFLDTTQIAAQTLGTSDGVFIFSFPHTASGGDVGKKYYVKIYSNGIGFCNFWINKGTTIDVSAVGGTSVNVGNRFVKFANYMPDWTCGELLTAFKQWAKVKFELDDYRKVINMDLIDTTLNVKPVDITNKVTSEVDYKLQDFTGAALSYDFGTTDKYVDGGVRALPTREFLGFYDSPASVPAAQRPGQFIIMLPTNEVWVSADNLFWDGIGSLYDTYKIGDGSRETKFRFAPIFMGVFTMGNSMVLPKIGEACSSAMFEMGDNDFTPRFAFYRGNQATFIGGSDYPFMSTGTKDINGTSWGNYSFDFYSTNSFFQKLNENFYNLLLKGEEVEFDFIADASTMLEFEKWHKVMNNYLEFVSKEITITFDKGKVRGRVTGLRK
jgi:hypothetical protein